MQSRDPREIMALNIYKRQISREGISDIRAIIRGESFSGFAVRKIKR